jgi:UDP:flavonoid glycosyltransferase YjiC (YdhE family)
MEAGHEVACATGPGLRDRVEAAGLRFWPAGPEHLTATARAELIGDTSDLPPMQRRAAHFSRIFVDYELPLRAAALEAVVDTWSPDLMVHETAEFAGPLVASAHGIPYATQSFGAVIDEQILAAAAEAAASHWHRAGLEPQPRAGLWRYVYLDNWPTALHDGTQPVGAPAVQRVRPVTTRPPTPSGEPCVYVTLGTVWNDDYALFRTMVSALGRLDSKVVLTVGDNGDPSRVGEVPANVQVATFIPQDEILPDCRLVVAHGGAGTTLGALAYGCPMLFVPQGADQHQNAARVTSAGAGLTATAGARSEADFYRLATELLSVRSFRQSAKSIAAEIADMPSPYEAALSLQRLIT